MFQYYAKPLSGNKEFKIWQNGNHPVEIFTHDFHEQKENYIHNNPVEAGLVTSPEFYRYSSANPLCKVRIARY
jgi:putative transposase